MSFSASSRLINIDPFCYRQFEKSVCLEKKLTFIDVPRDAFVSAVNDALSSGRVSLVDGYAPFCKHVFLPNEEGWSKCQVPILPVNQDTENLIKSAYIARTDKELPVLVRWIPRDSISPEMLPVAEFFDVILYSRDQIRKENSATGEIPAVEDNSPWGIVSIKPQMGNKEIPMDPITMMRNALPLEQGGSGTPLDNSQYLQSVKFWDQHVRVV